MIVRTDPENQRVRADGRRPRRLKRGVDLMDERPDSVGPMRASEIARHELVNECTPLLHRRTVRFLHPLRVRLRPNGRRARLPPELGRRKTELVRFHVRVPDHNRGLPLQLDRGNIVLKVAVKQTLKIVPERPLILLPLGHRLRGDGLHPTNELGVSEFVLTLLVAVALDFRRYPFLGRLVQRTRRKVEDPHVVVAHKTRICLFRKHYSAAPSSVCD